MNASMDEDLDRVAQRLRTWRDEAGLTLQQLADQCGVATSTVQKIETRQMVPTIAVLLKIASGLGRKVSDFVANQDASYQVHHSTAENRRTFGDGRRISVERLVGDLISPELEVWRVHCEAGVGLFREGLHCQGEVVVLCESGELTVCVDDRNYTLKPGDSLHYKAELRHTWTNDTNGPTHFLVIGSLPPALRAVIEDGDASETVPALELESA